MSNTRRLTQIDGLRGFAAIAVMIGHWGEMVRAHTPSRATAEVLSTVLLNDFSFGRLGIVAFFCISGFVVPFSFRGAHPLVAFPISRFFRLYPAYWFSIAAAILIYPLVDGPALSSKQVLANITMLELAFREEPVIGVYWTLTIEIIFYAICYVMFAASWLHKAWPNFVLMSAFALISLMVGAYRWVVPESALPLGIPTYLAAMHFGTLARLATLEGDDIAAKLYRLALPVLIVGIVAANTLAYLHAHNELVGWIAANTGYVAGVILFLLCVHRRWFGSPAWAWLGLISYSSYLLHMLVLMTGQKLWPFFADWRIAALVLTLAFFVVTILWAAVVQRIVEAPSVRLGRRLERAAEQLSIFRRSAAS